jgi:lipoprotein-anchoring transpeptidase ErfK/SrfK
MRNMTRNRLLATLGVWACAAAIGAVPAHATTLASKQMQVELLQAHRAWSQPGGRGATITVVPARAPLTSERTILPVLGARRVRGKGVWLRVRLPGRPNGHSGWIARTAATFTYTPWHVVVDVEGRNVQVYRAGKLVRTFKAVVGKPATPTPRGEFFVEEAIALGTTAVGGPYALALSARSNVLQEFEGGPGQIAIHGIDNLGGVPGTAVSHGCIRLPTNSIDWLVRRIGAGDPVTIR